MESDTLKDQEALKASESKYRTLFDAVNDAIFVHDPDTGAILDVNRKMVEMYGYTPDEARRITVEEISSGLPPYDQEGAVLKVRQAVEKGGLIFDWHSKDKWGRLFWAEVSLKSVIINGEPRIVATVRDITQRKQAESDLRQSRDLLQAVLDNAPAGLAVADRSGQVILANTAIREILGGPVTGTAYGPKGGYKVFTLDGQEATPEDLPLPRALRRGETTGVKELIIRRDDGGEVTALASATPLKNDTGEITGAIAVLQDITELKLTEKALRESQELLKLAMKTGKIGVIELDLETFVGILSEELQAIYMVPSDFKGTMEEWVKITPQEDIHEIMRKTSAAIARHGMEVESEYRVMRPDGSIRWLSSRGIIHYDELGKPRSMTAVAIDITDLKKAQEALRRTNEELERKVAERTGSLRRTARSLEEQKELLETIINHIPVMLVFYDSEGRIRLVNREFERLVGWSLEEVRNMGIVDLMAASYPDPEYRREVWEHVMEAKPGWKDMEIATRSGARLLSSWANVRLSDGSGIGIGIDIRELKGMEENILRLATAVDQAGEGIDLTTLEGIIKYVNPALERITGFSRDELVGANVSALPGFVSGRDEGQLLEYVKAEGKPFSARQVRKRKTGETIEVDITISPVFDETGKIVDTVSMTRDVTQEVRMQRQLAQAQKMEAIGSLAGGIAHDLKNIFTPILMNTEIALEDIELNHPALPVLEEVLNAARLGKDLVQQILTFSRRVPQNKVPVDISTIIRETLSFLRSTLPSTIEIQRELKDECVMAQADPTQIKQVLINLGSNAGHAMKKKGGVLDVSESSITLDAGMASEISPELAPGPYIQVSVHDTGHGMDEETMEHIFEPFFTTKKGEGTGMGLAVAHGIVKELGGAITVRSRPEQGSTFTVFLPRLQEKCKSTASGT